MTCIEAPDAATCDEVIESLRANNYGLIVLNNLQALFENNLHEAARIFVEKIAQTNIPVIVFDYSVRSIAYRLNLNKLKTFSQLEACSQIKENGRRLIKALDASLNLNSPRAIKPRSQIF